MFSKKSTFYSHTQILKLIYYKSVNAYNNYFGTCLKIRLNVRVTVASEFKISTKYSNSCTLLESTLHREDTKKDKRLKHYAIRQKHEQLNTLKAGQKGSTTKNGVKNKAFFFPLYVSLTDYGSSYSQREREKRRYFNTMITFTSLDQLAFRIKTKIFHAKMSIEMFHVTSNGNPQVSQ